MIRLMYERTDISTNQTVKFCHRCMSDAAGELALDDYNNIDSDKYAKRGLRIIETTD